MMTLYVSPRRRTARYGWRDGDTLRSQVHVPVDVVAEGDDYVITAYVPGIAADDLEIEVLDDTLSIRGEFPAVEGEEVRYLLRERPTGAFRRTLRLPAPLEAAEARAEVRDGVLTLRVSKAEQAKTKKIEVKTK